MQVLYEWRGAVDALAQFESMGAKVAYLTQSFRFGNEVARVANGLLTQLGADPLVQGYGELASVIGPIAEPDAILCRTNAGTVAQLFQQIAAGRTAALVGGGAEVTAFCKAATELMAGQSTQHPELAIFDSWMAVQEYVANDPQGGDLNLMVKLIDEFGADAILDALKTQPREEDADVVLSTAHKSKGREWATVKIAGDFKGQVGSRHHSGAPLRCLASATSGGCSPTLPAASSQHVSWSACS
jgi:superfamily I DNA/RNA helicase